MLAVFEDAALIDTAVQFENALANACAAQGLISDADRDAIAHASAALSLDTSRIVADSHHAGTLAIVLVEKLREAVARTSAGAASRVHLGSTRQDVTDTVSVIHYRRACDLLSSAGRQACDTLALLAEQHTDTKMLGRTLLRGARPITFGLKVSQWLTGLSEALARLQADASNLPLQLGGGVGTLAGLDGKGHAVAAHMATALELPMADFPWHTRRNCTVALGTSLAIVAGTLAKIAMDVALLGQDEIAEVFETRQPGRGGSSAMPNKRNPTSSQQALLATGRIPALAHTLLADMAQEYERGIAGWQAETGLLGEMFVWTFDAMLHVTTLIDGAEVDAAAMQRNLTAADVGEDDGEAQDLVARAVRNYRQERG
jgi:3-carboxy-cis,cis-muconate cycloisomerase